MLPWLCFFTYRVYGSLSGSIASVGIYTRQMAGFMLLHKFAPYIPTRPLAKKVLKQGLQVCSVFRALLPPKTHTQDEKLMVTARYQFEQKDNVICGALCAR